MSDPRDPSEPGDQGPDPAAPGDEDTGHGRKVDEDAEWRAIVAHFGDRALLPEPPEQPAGDLWRPGAEPVPRTEDDQPDPGTSWEDEGHFVPPEPPPLPTPPTPRLLAWIGLFGAPAVMLVGVIFGLHFPSLLSTALLLGFLGGFGYLVLTMRKGPDDWTDDGARL